MADQERIRQFYATLSDEELRQSHVVGLEAYTPDTWSIITHQMSVRRLDNDEVGAARGLVEKGAPADHEPTSPDAVTRADRIRTGVFVTGALAALLAIVAIWASLTRSGWVAAVAFAFAIAFAINGARFRRDGSVTAAGASLVLSVLLALTIAIPTLISSHGSGVLGVAFLFGAPIYWLGHAYQAARDSTTSTAASPPRDDVG